MEEKVEEAFWRLESALLAPPRRFRAFRDTLGSIVSSIERALKEEECLTPQEETLAREELAHLVYLCLCLRRCRWRSALTRGWAAKHLPGIVSSDPPNVSPKPHTVSSYPGINEAKAGIVSSGAGIVSCDCGIADIEALLRRQAEITCAEGPCLLIAIRSRCLLVTAVAALLVFVQANITGPPFSPSSATEKLEIRHEEEGRQKHPDLYPPKPAAAAAAAAAAGTAGAAGATATAGAAATAGATATAGEAAASDGVCCCCCCSFCGFCPRDEALSATAAAAARGVMRQRRCYCEFEVERDSALLGSPMETATETAKRLPAVAAILTIDGEAVYEDVRGLAYLWFARLLFKTLETLQLSAGAPRLFPGASKDIEALAGNPAAAAAAAAAAATAATTTPTAAASAGGAGGGDRLKVEGLGFRGPLSLFVWKARADFLLQKSLRSGGGASGSMRASVAPSLIESVLFDFAAVLQQLHLLPEGFSCTSSEAVEMDRLLEAADFGSFGIKKNQEEVEKEIKKFRKDVSGLVVNQKERFCLIPPLPSAASTAADAAAPIAATVSASAAAGAAGAARQTTRGSARLLLRQGLEDVTSVDFAALLPDPQWNMACECFGVEFVLTGAPGIRRKYQTEALPQLVVSAAFKKGGGGEPAAAKHKGGPAQMGAPQSAEGSSLDAPHESSSSNSDSSNSSNSDSSSSSNSSSSTSSNSSSSGATSVASNNDRCISNGHSGSSSINSSGNNNSSRSSSREGEKQSQPISDGGEETCATEGASTDSEETPVESRRRLWRLEDVREDTDIMERPVLANGVDWETFERPLGVTEQALLLSKSRAIIESSPCNDPLALEEVGAVVSRALVLPPAGSTAATNSSSSNSMREYYKLRHSFLLSQPPEDFTDEPNCQLLSPDWVVFSGGLWLRCCAEFHRTKTVERACLQLHALCEQLVAAQDVGGSGRLSYRR
ncbi:hypothetical protein ACSSS7_000841 [Eimeria intestinalis]